MPWKNGGGITHEVAREPAQGESFEWRLSLARIDRSGPFSDFSGYLRIMLLLEGDGFTLRSPGEPDRVFQPLGEAQRFDGALPMQCELAGGSCTDLNLMVRATREVSTRTARLDASLTLSARGRLGDARRDAPGNTSGGAPYDTLRGTLILFVLQGSCHVRYGAREVELAAWDTAIVEAVGAECFQAEAVQAGGVQPATAQLVVYPAPGADEPAKLFIANVY